MEEKLKKSFKTKKRNVFQLVGLDAGFCGCISISRLSDTVFWRYLYDK